MGSLSTNVQQENREITSFFLISLPTSRNKIIYCCLYTTTFLKHIKFKENLYVKFTVNILSTLSDVKPGVIQSSGPSWQGSALTLLNFILSHGYFKDFNYILHVLYILYRIANYYLPARLLLQLFDFSSGHCIYSLCKNLIFSIIFKHSSLFYLTGGNKRINKDKNDLWN